MSLRHSPRSEITRIEIEVELDGNLVDEAEALGVNISEACESGLLAEVRKIRIAKWQEENKEGFEEWNKYVEEYGIPLARYNTIVHPCSAGLRLKSYATIITDPSQEWEKPGIYCWEIEGIGKYVGKYTNSNRPLREYCNNVRKLCANEPYRKSKPSAFRKIHTALHSAMHDDRHITLRLLENTAVHRLNDRERHWISVIQPNLNG